MQARQCNLIDLSTGNWLMIRQTVDYSKKISNYHDGLLYQIPLPSKLSINVVSFILT